MQHKHYSFDLWDTLIRPNPEYKEQRKRYFHIYLLTKHGILRNGDEIEEAFQETWKYFDQVSRLFGKAPNCLEMYAMVLFKLTGKLTNLTPLKMELIYKELEQLFLKYPPTLYDNDTKDVLQELKMRAKTMSLLSNTSFIRGKTLDVVLETLGIKNHFLFRIYSDELGYSKPHRECFRAVDDKLPYDIEDVMHVGDSELYDGAGAHEYGFGYMIINQPKHQAGAHYTIKDLL